MMKLKTSSQYNGALKTHRPLIKKVANACKYPHQAFDYRGNFSVIDRF